MNRFRAGAGTLVFVLALTACGDVDPDPTAPGAAPEAAASGEALYQANCASCHGTDLRGTDKGPSHLSVVYEPGHHGDASFLLAVRNGSQQHHWRFGDMPPIEGLSEQDVAAITAFVRERQETEGFEPYPP